MTLADSPEVNQGELNPEAVAVQERLAEAMHAMLEVGPGNKPSQHTITEGFGDMGVYIGWHIDPVQYEFALQNHIGRNKLAVCAPHGEGVPISDYIRPQTIDIAIMSNVIGESNWDGHYAGMPGMNPLGGDNYAGATGMYEKIAAISKVYDMLKPRGQLKIIETYTPDKVPTNLDEILRSIGFDEVYRLERGDREFAWEMEMLNKDSFGSHQEGFMLVASKVDSL